MDISQSTYKKNQEEQLWQEFAKMWARCDNCRTDSYQEIEKAFFLAKDAHSGQFRKTGEPYIIHPVEVARIVGEEMRLDAESVISALLHDVVEDTLYTYADISEHFGKDIADIVQGLTKIRRVYKEDVNIDRTNIQAENFIKLLETISVNIRVIYIKIADRLHNMRTLENMPTNKQLEKAGEVLYVYSPLAHRLGLHELKSELEDISFKARQPEEYRELVDQIEARREFHDKILDWVVSRMQELFKNEEIPVTIKKRKRGYYSTWKRMRYYNVTLDELENFLAVRLIFEDMPTVKEDKLMCWRIYGLICQNFSTSVNRIKDWLNRPRSNGYVALHGAVLAYKKWVDTQIMSRRMAKIADLGYGLNSQYFNPNYEKNLLDNWLDHVTYFLNEKEDGRDKTEILDILKDNLYISDILVYTPMGDTLRLPKNSTVLDFAFHIHTELGKRCIGANVNSKLRKRSYVLQNGDTVDVLTSELQSPDAEWYNSVVSAQGKSKLKKAFREEYRNEVEKGEKKLKEILDQLNMKMDEKIINKLEDNFDFLFKYDLYYKIAMNYYTTEDISQLLDEQNDYTYKSSLNRRLSAIPFINIGNQKTEINHKNVQKLDSNFNTGQVVLKNCCHPIPGDDASGYVDHLGRIIVHRNDCPEMERMVGNSDKKIFKIDWTRHKTKTFTARFEIKGIDRIKLLRDIIRIISDNFHINIHNFNIQSFGSVFSGFIDLKVHGVAELKTLEKKLRNIGGMEEVIRIVDF